MRAFAVVNVVGFLTIEGVFSRWWMVMALLVWLLLLVREAA